jgi:RNA polymerase sigma factor (sigma-70 family)
MLRKNAYDPEDAAQDVFLNLLKYKETGKEVKDIKNVEGLLWMITTNVCLNLLKTSKWKHGEDFLFNGEEIYPAAGDEYTRIDERLSLQSILEDESEELKCYFYMHYYDGMGYVEIAEAVGKSKSWVGKTLSAFREKARKKLGEIK